ncbi:hypothetical protein JCM3774_002398 [Rhodotorula dairenensis]
MERARDSCKLASTTPTLPLELPPYSSQLVALVEPVFAPAPADSSRPTSPTKQPPAAPAPAHSAEHQPVSRLGQLVSSVAHVGAVAAATATGAASAAAAGDHRKPLSVKCVEAAGQRLYVAASDGAVRLYEVNDAELHPADAGPVTPAAPSRTTTEPSRQVRLRSCPLVENRPRADTSLAAKQAPTLELMDQVFVTISKKAADRIVLLPRLNKAAILSEGVLTFHTLPNLAPLDVNRFPAIRGIVTFAVDEDDLAGGGSPDTMHMCAIKRKRMHWIRITDDGVTSIKDLPLPTGALIAVLRQNRICMADAENYSIVDLEAAEGLPLLPISQSPHPDPPLVTSSSVASGAVTPPVPGSVPDPRQRPAIACVGTNEFLIASHTGNTTLGVFVTESGDPCRGTLEWASNVRSLVVDGQYTVALLYNNTIEVHSIHTQEITQVVTLAGSTGLAEAPFQPRHLYRSAVGLQFGAATGAHKVDLVEVALLPASLSSSSVPSSTGRSELPRTPSKRTSRASISSASVWSGLSRGGEADDAAEKRSLSRILVTGRNGVYTLSPMTLVVQADALLDKGRDTDALALADNYAKSLRRAADDAEAEGGLDATDYELCYVYMRLAFRALAKTAWQDAFDLFRKAQADPRIVVRLFPDLRQPFMSVADQVSVCRGVREEVLAMRTVDQYVLESLNHNYSPHIKPDVESASSTAGLRASLTAAARDCLLSYLLKWRAARRSGEGDSGLAGDSRKVDIVVDTSLVKLLAEHARPDDIRVLLAGPHDVVLPEIEQSLLDAGMYQLLAEIWLEKRETAKVLDLWSRIVDGEYEQGNFADGVRRIYDLTWKSKDPALTEKYALWLVKHDSSLALKLLADPKQTLVFDTRSIFNKLSRTDSDVADRFLESAVIQERDTDASLHADLVKRYIKRLAQLLEDPESKAHLRAQESEYAELTASTSSPPTFLHFLASRYSPDAPRALLNRIRLKALLFLNSSTKYDLEDAKKELEAMETRGLRGLTLERAVVYGKLHLDRQALSLLLHTLHDLESADAYCLQAGDPLCDADISTCTTKLGLPVKLRSRRAAPTSAAKRETDERRRRDLAKLLVEMCLSMRAQPAPRANFPTEEMVAKVVGAQTLHLDALETLSLLDATFPLGLLADPLSRFLRRSAHLQQESSILKSLAVGQNLAVQDRAFRAAAKFPPTIERGASPGPGQGVLTRETEKRIVRVDLKEGGGDRVFEGLAEKGAADLQAPISLEDAVELDLR